MSEQRGFFDLDERYAALSAAGDPLEKLGRLIDFEIFRPALNAALQRSDGSKGGRSPMDAVMMFKGKRRSGATLRDVVAGADVGGWTAPALRPHWTPTLE